MNMPRPPTTRTEISPLPHNSHRFEQLPSNFFFVSLHHYGYGAGRRVCPGVHLAERNMWRITAKLLWAFNIYEPIDPVTKKTIPLDENAYNSCILVSPLPFKVRVVPRSDKHLQAVRREKENALRFLSQWD